MKYSIVIGLIMMVAWGSCSKNHSEEPIAPSPPIDTAGHIIELGSVSVLKNNEPWAATFLAKYYPNDKGKIHIVGSVLNNLLLNEFVIVDIPCKTGKHFMERYAYWNLYDETPQALYYVTLDVDQNLNSYEVDTTVANQYVEILHYDSVAQTIEGRFQTVLEGPNTWSFLPDTIKMTEGKFYLKIKE